MQFRGERRGTKPEGKGGGTKETQSEKGEQKISTKKERKAGIKRGFQPQKAASSQALQVISPTNSVCRERYSCRTCYWYRGLEEKCDFYRTELQRDSLTMKIQAVFQLLNEAQ